MTLLKDVVTISGPGIIAFVNDLDKTVYLAHSVDMARSIASNAGQLRDGIHPNIELQRDYRNYVVDIAWCTLGPVTDIELKVMYSVCLEDYIKRGYRNLREGFVAPKFRLKAYIERDYRRTKGCPFSLVYVCAISKRQNKEIIGIFETMDEAKAYMAELRPTPDAIVVPRRHTGDLTVGYYKRKRKPLF